MSKYKKFDLTEEFKFYLKQVNLKEAELPMIQKKEMKRAFFGACGQLLIMFKDKVALLEAEVAVEVMQDLLEQVRDFFKKEIE